MADRKLEMTFKNQIDGKARISIDAPRADLTEAEVKTAMDNIIAKNLFNATGGDLVAVAGARVITTDVQELTL
ncbi:DUF2922 domain-containing protein [Brassicibacter mesophilus]|uniref:DUF2922 domain-containing protein n=1 Tax=Brassicibacter mesophilus TaxID=745119 RepID=UPI003D1FC982